nr:MAG TPA: hypothetical protein [Bacteriophage sp.]
MGYLVKTRKKSCKTRMASIIISFRYDVHIFLLALEMSLFWFPKAVVS